MLTKKVTLTLNQPEHGTVSATVDGASVASGGTVPSGKTVTLAADPEEGYALKAWSVTYDDYGTVSVGMDNTFAMPDDDTTVTAAFADDLVSVAYADAAGVSHTVWGKALTGNETELTAGVYAATGDLAYTATIQTTGDVALILADDCAMRIDGGNGESLHNNGMFCSGNLTVYGQSAGTGKLQINCYNAAYGVFCGDYVQHGGDVLIRNGGTYGECIHASDFTLLGGSLNVEGKSKNGDVCASEKLRVLGGRLSATGYGLYGRDGIVLGWTNATDSIFAAYYNKNNNCGVTVADGQTLTDGTNLYNGELDSDALYAIRGQTLYPAFTVSVADGTGSGDYAAGATVTITANAPATGKVFDKWTSEDGVTFADATSAETTFTMPAKAVTVTATYKNATYAVTLNTNGGNIVSGSVTSYTFGTEAALPTNVTRDGYAFGGWYDNASFAGSPVTAIGATETGNKTFYAKWTLVPSLAGGKVTAPAGAVLILASYDANGRMTSVQSKTLTENCVNKSLSELGLTVPSGAYKLMLVDGATYAPLCAAWEKKN